MNNKVLVIEDDEQIRRIYAQAFEAQGFVCIAEENGNVALNNAQKDKPDIILLDIMMPGIDGLGVLDKLKQDENLSKIPVIMLTNLTAQEVIDMAIKKGAKEFINKSSVKPREVVEKVRVMLSQNPQP